MTITLAELVSRLQADAPAVSGVPSSTQYEQAIKDAVSDLSRRASVVRTATISVVSGTASYALPGDFVKLIRLSAIGVAIGDSVYVTPAGIVPAGGLVPLSDAYREILTVVGGTLTISPTPTVSADRTLIYAAGDALSSGSYATLTEERASVALLHARAACLERIASSPGGQAVKITAGGDTVDFGQATTATRAEAQQLRAEYLLAVDGLNRAVGGLG